MMIQPTVIFTTIENLQREFQGYLVLGNGQIISPSGKALTPRKVRRRLNSGFCWRVNIKGKDYRVHRLMAHLFLGMPLNSKKQVNHIDKNTMNNRLWNLEILTPKGNARHRSKK